MRNPSQHSQANGTKNWEVESPYYRKDFASSRYLEEWAGPGQMHRDCRSSSAPEDGLASVRKLSRLYPVCAGGQAGARTDHEQKAGCPGLLPKSEPRQKARVLASEIMAAEVQGWLYLYHPIPV